MDDELLDLVNEQDVVIGTIHRSEYQRLLKDELGYIRAVALFIQDDQGKLWIPKRSPDKKIAPNGLDCSMQGHVGAGEDYEKAALRESREELNLKLQSADITFVKKIRFQDIRYFMNLYLVRSNQAPDYNPKDFVSASWLTPAEVLALIQDGVPAKDTLRTTIEALQDL